MDDHNKKVLIIEDDDMLRGILMDQFTKQYTTFPAKDGEEALREIEKERPNLIILDLLLPKVSGFDILEKLRANPDPAVAKIPVLVVSNLADQESINRAQSQGIEAYFTKADVTVGVLTNRVKRIFEEIPQVA
ncbi:MAG: response regulator [Patescibacteria group bacterium]|nr:response regulator [Patescibacteria group bacterium]